MYGRLAKMPPPHTFLSKLPLTQHQKHQKLYALRAGFDLSKFTIAPQYINIIDDIYRLSTYMHHPFLDLEFRDSPEIVLQNFDCSTENSEYS